MSVILRRITRPVIVLGSRVLALGWQCRECAGEWLEGEPPSHDPDCLARTATLKEPRP